MFVSDRNEPCIIDDTPQVPKTAGVKKGIRANVVQTSLLKKAYEQSNVLSSQHAKILAEETGLPSKWILQWFSRQRTKDRKNDVNYKPRLKASVMNSASTNGSGQASNSAAFSAAFFSDSGSAALATSNTSAREIMTIKSEVQDLGFLGSTPSVSGSTNMEGLTPLVSEPPSVSASASGRLDMVAHEDSVMKISGIGRKNFVNYTLHSGLALKQASDSNAQTRSTDGANFRLLKLHSPGDATYGRKLPDDASSGTTEPDTDAYTQPSSPPTPQERRAPTPSAPQVYLPHIVPPRRSPIVTSHNEVRFTGKEIKKRHRPSRLSLVNVPKDGSEISFHQGNYFSIPMSTVTPAAKNFSHKNLAFSVSQTQFVNNRPSVIIPWDRQSTAPQAQIAEPVLYSKRLDPGNRLAKANPLVAVVSSFPDFVELDFAMDSLTETFRANFPDMLSSFHQDDELTFMASAFPKGYRPHPVIGAHPSTDATLGYYGSVTNSDHLEALDPSRAPLKHLTGILAEYRAEDGTYLRLLVGLQDPARRRKIIGCLSNEELLSHDPFAAAMGLALLSRLGVL